MKRLVVLALGALLALGCGSSKSAQHDAGAQEDASAQLDGPRQQDAAQHDAAVTCGFAASLGTPTFVDSFADVGTDLDPASEVYFEGYLNSNATPDVFEVELLGGYGVFADAIATGTYELTGDEQSWETCGLCVTLYYQLDESTWEANQYYMPTSGTVELTSVNGRITGTVSSLSLRHVAIDWDTFVTTPLNDGCTVQITSVAFDGEIVTPDGGFLPHDGGTD
jgi:hypothetical protein